MTNSRQISLSFVDCFYDTNCCSEREKAIYRGTLLIVPHKFSSHVWTCRDRENFIINLRVIQLHTFITTLSVTVYPSSLKTMVGRADNKEPRAPFAEQTWKKPTAEMRNVHGLASNFIIVRLPFHSVEALP